MIKEQVNIESIILHFNKQKRKKMIISVTTDKMRTFAQAVKGKSSDTKLLNINLKTLTLAYLRNLQTANQLSLTAVLIKNLFAEMPPSFQSFSYLFFGPDQQKFYKAGNRQIQQDFHKKGREDKMNDNEMPNTNREQYILARRDLRNQCRNYYRSTQFIKKFMISGRMFIQNKLIILKYLGRIQQIGHKRFKQKENQWKNIINY